MTFYRWRFLWQMLKQFNFPQRRRWQVSSLTCNPIIREWFLQNLFLDKEEEDQKFKLLLQVINPRLFSEEHKSHDKDQLAVAVAKRLRSKQPVADAVKASIQKSLELAKRWQHQQDDFSLNAYEE